MIEGPADLLNPSSEQAGAGCLGSVLICGGRVNPTELMRFQRKMGPFRSKTLHCDFKRGWFDAGSPWRLRIRGLAGLRAWRDVRPGQRAIAVAADADVRPYQRNQPDRRGIWQGAGARRARRQAGPLVLRLSFQERSR